MKTALASAGSLARVHRRGSLLSILEQQLIMAGIRVFDDGHFAVETRDWNSYWHTLYELNDREVQGSLDALQSAWKDYLRSGFDSLLRQEFCFRYFSLLDILLSNCREADVPYSWLHVLQVTLGFECFGITSSSNSEILGAGICTLRNPCYLLAKLKMPDVLDDPQFLPIITVAGDRKPELFYHYRQYTLSVDSPMSLMFYPAISGAKRSASFRLINSLAGGVSYSIDPRTREQAQRLCQGIIRPIMEANKLTESETACIELVDVGAGSGSLTSCICREIQEMTASTGFHPKFRLWFVDLEPSDPTRFFRAKRLRGLVDSLTFLGNDYRDWLSQPQPLPPANGLRIVLISRLLNNLSRFYIRRLSGEESHLILNNRATTSGSEIYLPSVCLAPDRRGTESLLISNARVALCDGRTFAQASLARFYEGLFLLTTTTLSESPTDGLFLPVRTFNPDCLLTPDDKSVISRLAENCDYIVIEDADLRQQDLIEHTTRFSLHSVVVYDMTKALRLTGNYAYVVWPKTRAVPPNFAGEQIW